MDINNESDRSQLADMASDTFKKVKEKKYNEHQITESPYLVLKSDNGTYGMGVISIKDPSDILSLNRKKQEQTTQRKVRHAD